MNNTLHRLADLLLDVVFLVEEGGRIAYVNDACTAVFGYLPSEMTGRQILDFIHPADLQRTIDEMRHVVKGRHGLGFENRYLRKDGSVAHIMWTARWSEEDQLRIGVARDVSERKMAEQRQAGMLALSTAAHGAESLDALFTAFHAILLDLMPLRGLAAVLDPGARVAYAAALPGATGGAVPDTTRWYAEPMSTPGMKFGELRFDVERAALLSGHDRDVLQFAAAQAAAVVERLALNADLAYAARYDELTGLPNRRLFQDRIQSAFARCRRDRSGGALLFIDLDDFKRVNDAYGHAIGDQLLQAVARRITACVRECDTVARIGGDEFVALLEHVETMAQARAVTEKIHKAIGKPLPLPGVCLQAAASIGIALYPEHGDAADQLMRYADQAMYACKAAHKAARAQAAEASHP
ncbi:GGDEF domain-containing protein [Pseudoduganella ginsengisoli]|uniref:Diguanylate cyclase n=1 Tax=Pseudoduganella ginsengisoli TaxID=1462440 RepID=A0A6L6Q989_9BURK|nr:diguanylate cyclase [Pseudoduganella ginsengisoli]MTW05782.1 diguanylate cyclase [Pseudoduganella ginsengisoli]